MPLKAELTIILKADDTVVAESTDDTLWHEVLQAVLSGSSLKNRDAPPLETGAEEEKSVRPGAPVTSQARNDLTEVASFAAKIGVSEDEVRAACDPSDEPPYLHLDSKCWEALQKRMPERGPGRVGAIQVAGTLLALWLSHRRKETPATQALAQNVLGTIGLTETNPTRSIRNCAWLQPRGSGAFQMNPAKISVGYALARAYCKGTSIEWPD